MTAASAEMLRNGVTTSVEMYFHPERIAAAVGRTGARAVIATPLLPLPGLPPFDELGVPGRRGVGGRSDPADQAVVDVDDGVRDDGTGAVPDHDGAGGEPVRHGHRI